MSLPPQSFFTHSTSAQLKVGSNCCAVHELSDDMLQRQSRGVVMPESFTHGSSAQRVSWFRRGLQSGSIEQCNTFDSRNL